MHTLQEVNAGLTEGRYFFIDIARDGIALYEAEGSELAKPQPQTLDQPLAMAREYFDEWLPSAQQFFRHFQVAVEDGAPKVAAEALALGASMSVVARRYAIDRPLLFH